MTELKWVDGIIIGMNEPDVSGYAIVNNGIVESYPIPSEFNEIIKETLAKGRAAMELLKEIDDYLKPNPKNYIGTGSILHQKVQEIVTRKEGGV